jgi:hypothetical protein
MGDGYLGLIHRLSTLEPPQRSAFTRLGTFRARRDKDVTAQARLREYPEERDLPATDPSMSSYGHSEP